MEAGLWKQRHLLVPAPVTDQPRMGKPRSPSPPAEGAAAAPCAPGRAQSCPHGLVVNPTGHLLRDSPLPPALLPVCPITTKLLVMVAIKFIFFFFLCHPKVYEDTSQKTNNMRHFNAQVRQYCHCFVINTHRKGYFRYGDTACCRNAPVTSFSPLIYQKYGEITLLPLRPCTAVFSGFP